MRFPKPFFRTSKRAWYLQLGKRQLSLGKDRDEAYRRYRRWMAEQGAAPPAWGTTVATVCDLFLDWSSRHNLPDTYEWYRSFLQDFCDHCGGVDACDLKPYHVTNWLDGHAWNPSSQRAAITCVKRAFNFATDQGFIERNPVKNVKKPPVVRRETILASDEQKAIRENTKDEPFRDYLFALQETGCRPGEVAKITAAGFDLEAGLWNLPNHKTLHKTGEPRVVYLTPSMVTLCRRLAREHPEGPIFRNTRGGPWTRNAIRCRFRRLRKKLNLPDGVVAYSIRHTYATEALVNGVDPISLCELLGHSDVSMLMKHYQHLAQKKEHLRDAAERARRGA